MNNRSSPGRLVWQKLKRNPTAMFGLVLLIFCCVIAIGGYLFVPDKSPNANHQVPEISLEKPGFTITMLKQKTGRDFQKVSFTKKMFSGQQTDYQYIPIISHQQIGDSMLVEIYQGRSLETGLAEPGFPQAYALKDLKESDLFEEKTYWLGTDRFGRCILSRLMIGVRISLVVGLIAVLISLTIGIFLGAVAGYAGGRIDALIMLLINTIWSVPTLLLVFALVITLGSGFWQIFIAVGLTMWVDVARLVRGQVLSFRGELFVEAGFSMGFSHARILFRHILPNLLGPVLVIGAANFATAILLEAGLGYLGFGIQPPHPSWGNMLNENYRYLFTGNNPFPALSPGIAIMLMVMAFNLIGNGLRDAIDVKIT